MDSSFVRGIIFLITVNNFNLGFFIELFFTSVFFKLFSSRPIFHGQIFSRPLKKGLHLESISDSAIFAPKSRCSPKKKKVFI